MIWLTTGGQERPSTMSCPHLAAKRGRRGRLALCLAASGGRQPCAAHIWRLLEKPSWALSPMSGGQWRPSAMIWLTTGGQERPSTMSCPHLAAKRGRRGHLALCLAASGGRQRCPSWRLAAVGEAVVGTQPYVWRPVEAVRHVLPTSGGCWRSRRGHSALRLAASRGRQRSSSRLLAAKRSRHGHLPSPFVWRLLEKPSWALSPMSGGQWRPSALIFPTSGGCWRSRRGHLALCLAASGGRQP